MCVRSERRGRERKNIFYYACKYPLSLASHSITSATVLCCVKKYTLTLTDLYKMTIVTIFFFFFFPFLFLFFPTSPPVPPSSSSSSFFFLPSTASLHLHPHHTCIHSLYCLSHTKFTVLLALSTCCSSSYFSSSTTTTTTCRTHTGKFYNIFLPLASA